MVLGIYCAGGFGSVTLALAKTLNEAEHRWEDVFFIDDTADVTSDKAQVVAFDDFLRVYSPVDGQIVIAAGEPVVRERLFEKVKKNGYSLPNLIDPMAQAKEFSKVGEGNIVLSFAYISPGNVRIGNNNIFMPFSQVSHDNRIGSHCVLATSACLSGNTTMEDRAYIGTGSKLREGITIGYDAIVGMGAIVTKSVENESVVVGSPAKEIRKNSGRVFSESKGT